MGKLVKIHSATSESKFYQNKPTDTEFKVEFEVNLAAGEVLKKNGLIDENTKLTYKYKVIQAASGDPTTSKYTKNNHTRGSQDQHTTYVLLSYNNAQGNTQEDVESLETVNLDNPFDPYGKK